MVLFQYRAATTFPGHFLSSYRTVAFSNGVYKKAKACVVATLGAALGLEEMAVKSKPTAVEQNWVVVRSARAQVNLCHDAPDCSEDVRGRMNLGKALGGAEEPLRMVLYLSCWGPN